MLDKQQPTVGHRVALLTLRGNWQVGILRGPPWGVALDNGTFIPIHSRRYLRPHPAPTPSLQVGNFVAVTHADPPLEKLVGATGRIDKIMGELAWVSIAGSQYLLRGTALKIAQKPIAVGQFVKHPKVFKNQVGIVKEISDFAGQKIAYLDYLKGPLYPANLEELIEV